MAEGTNTPEFIDVETLMLQRLLRLFPHKELKAEWPGFSNTKEKMIEGIVQRIGTDRIYDFVADQCRTCRQHVYLFAHSTPLQDLPSTLISDLLPISSTFQNPAGQAQPDHPLLTDRVQRTDVYIAEGSYTVYLREPPEEEEEQYLRPIMVQVTDQFCLVRFVKLQKNLRAEFGDRHVRSMPFSLTEEEVCEEIAGLLEIGKDGGVVDLNPAVKALFEQDILDVSQVRSKDSDMTSTHELDMGKTIKRDLSPEQQQDMLMRPNLVKIRLEVMGWTDIEIDRFLCIPIEGFIDFSKYSEQGDADYVLREIIQNLR